MVATTIAGLVAGILHALAGADHVAAVTPLSMSSQGRAWRVGARWGLGHATGVAAIGAIFLPLRSYFDLEQFSWWSERWVGAMLIAVGLWGLRRASSKWLHSHEHQHRHDDSTHAHIHLHREGHESDEQTAHRHTHAAFAVGLLHGLAGAGHLFGVVPAMALPTGLAVTYLVSYGTGNLVAMGAFAGFVGWAAQQVADVGLEFYRFALGACSVTAVGVGLFWLIL